SQEDGTQWNWSITSSNGMGGWMKLGIHGANQTGKHYMISDGKWRHLAVSMTPTGESSFSLDLFIDGRQETKFLSTINKDNFEINTQPSDLYVGGDGFSGWIDDLRIYSTRLSSGEISMILEEKTSDDLAITRGSYSLSAWIKPTDLPESNRFNFAHARFFWRDWAGDVRIDTWPHDMRKTGIPQFDPSSDRLSELFEEPVSFYALAVDNNPNTDAGWDENYIGYLSTSISESGGFFSDTNLTDGPWLLENENGGTAYSPDFLSSLSETPNSYASSFGTSFDDYGTFPRGFTIAHGSLAFEPDGTFAPGLFYLRAGGAGRNTFWLDTNQNLTFDEVDSGERIIRSDHITYHEKVLFLGHQIPIIATPGIENDRGLAITGKRSISSWEQNGDETVSSSFEYSLNQGEWTHVVITVNRESNQLSSFVNGRMVSTVALKENELPEPRLGDWFIGGPGPFNSSQYFAGQIDDLRMYDDALTPEEIARIYNGGEGDIGLVGTVSAPVVTDEETVTFRIAFEKFEKGIEISGITEAEINASLTNGEIVGGSLVPLDSGVFEFDATFTSYQQMILDLPRGTGSSETEDTLRVLHKISRVPEVPLKEDLVHWWWLDESIGKSVSDSMGTSDGTIQGGASWTADSIYGTAVSFRNEGDFISLGLPDANLSKEE
ncbi:MAG: LamG-like jellyroll fold domain-containing protein, partial [Opitutales bacterium]